MHPVPEHHFERLADAEVKQREELNKLVTEGTTQVKRCEEASGNLGSTLSELEMQHDNARALIEESFQVHICFDVPKELCSSINATNSSTFKFN